MNNQNLKPWKPGQSGNPGGRPKSTQLRQAIRELLDAADTQDALAKALVSHAKQGNMQAMRILLDCDPPNAIGNETLQESAEDDSKAA